MVVATDATSRDVLAFIIKENGQKTTEPTAVVHNWTPNLQPTDTMTHRQTTTIESGPVQSVEIS